MTDVNHTLDESVLRGYSCIEVAHPSGYLLLRLLSKACWQLGDLRVEHRIHLVERHMHLYRWFFARQHRVGERAGSELATLLGIGVEAERGRVGRIALGELFLAQPFAEEQPHLVLQPLTFGSQVAGRILPSEPYVSRIRHPLQYRAFAHQRRADIMTAQYEQLLQLILVLKTFRALQPLGLPRPLGRLLRRATNSQHRQGNEYVQVLESHINSFC